MSGAWHTDPRSTPTCWCLRASCIAHTLLLLQSWAGSPLLADQVAADLLLLLLLLDPLP
jgi:hypothetical protein